MEHITADLKVTSKLLVSYLRYVFKSVPETGALHVPATNDMGKYLIACLKVSEEPPRPMEGENIVHLCFSESRATWDLADKWLYYPDSFQKRINYYLKAVFDLDFLSYYRKGEALNMAKKEIVEAFITSRHLCPVENYEALHKQAYRYQRKVFEDYTRMLMYRVDYINRILDTTGLKEQI